MVRDQANKTLEIFLQRVRKYAQSLPETVEPPVSSARAQEKISRTGTPQTDTSSWAGWAMSSFTNKLASVSGQMQVENNAGDASAAPETRPSSVPPVSSTPQRQAPSTSPLQSLKSPASAKGTMGSNPLPQTAAPFPTPNEPVEDFDALWDGGGNEWGEGDADDEKTDDPFASKSKNEAAVFDDKGEPDFEGWLNAQSQAKTLKKPLPKGLTKSKTSGRPAMTKANSTSKTVAKSTLGTKSTVVIKPKKEEPKSKQEEDEDWGESWD
jgi:SCY1-like protein 1